MRCAHRETGQEYDLLLSAHTPQQAVAQAAAQGHMASTARPLERPTPRPPPAQSSPIGGSDAEAIAEAVVRRIGEDEYLWRRMENVSEAAQESTLYELRKIRRSWLLRFPTRVVASGVGLAILV